MRAVVDAAQAAGVDVAVDLCRRERAVAEQLLDHAEVGAALEQMGGERVAEPMRVRDQASERARVESAPPRREEKRVLGTGAGGATLRPGAAGFAGGASSLERELRAAVGEIGRERGCGP